MNRIQRMSVLSVLFVAAVLVFATGARGAASIVLREQYPVSGERTDLLIQSEDGLPIAGATVKVVYRPGSSVERSEEIGTTGDSGRVSWTPAVAGIAALSATFDGQTISQNVSVKFASTPIGGVLIMILAGLLLVGGSAVRISRVLRSAD